MEILIDPDRPSDFNQALMDWDQILSPQSTHGQKRNPVKEFSAAYQHGTMDRYPIKGPKKTGASIFNGLYHQG